MSAAEIPFIAGHVALDFVNTAEERGHPAAGDALHSAGDLRVWGVRRGVLASGADGAPAELPPSIEARELLYRLFLDRARGQPTPEAERELLGRLAARAYQEGRLGQEPDGRLTWSWDPSRLATVRYVAVSAAVQLLGQSPAARLKQCPGDHCGWFFLDATKRGNRRWCSMSECGQEAKTARRRDRAN
jgi:predicted RNA-binding Zn ribbon-like protein